MPQDFPAPIRGDSAGDFAESLWTVGSVPRLAEELDAVAAALGLPEGADFDDAAVMAEVDAALQGAAEAPAWLAQPVAVYMLLLLRAACRRSMATGAAINFT
ncbi:hypothetical protein ACQ5SO_01175 [Rhodovulum sp. DZ06]|uniref:hypothetical protein n=1 Tax=Rhodovulum sp. DZ06 TaxID=3425126 RepID=UPI003D33C661